MADDTTAQTRSYPRPRYFVVRRGTRTHPADHSSPAQETVVPLIAADELPEWMVVCGAPREMAMAQTAGMVNLGSLEGRREGEGVYEILINPEQTRDQAAGHGRGHGHGRHEEGLQQSIHAPRHTTMAQSTQRREQSSMTPSVADSGGMRAGDKNEHHHHGRYEAEPETETETARPTLPFLPLYPVLPGSTRISPNTTATAATMATTTTTTTTARTTTPQQQQLAPETSLCRHWCNYGTCRWATRCRYEHRMPTTPEGLAEVGLRDYPPWWVAASLALAGGKTVVPGLLGGFFGSGFGSGLGSGWKGDGRRQPWLHHQQQQQQQEEAWRSRSQSQIGYRQVAGLVDAMNLLSVGRSAGPPTALTADTRSGRDHHQQQQQRLREMARAVALGTMAAATTTTTTPGRYGHDWRTGSAMASQPGDREVAAPMPETAIQHDGDASDGPGRAAVGSSASSAGGGTDDTKLVEV